MFLIDGLGDNFNDVLLTIFFIAISEEKEDNNNKIIDISFPINCITQNCSN